MLNITQDLSLCPNSTAGVDELSFYNAPICVGNYYEMFQRSLGEKVVGYGTYIPIVHTLSFGSLECDACSNALEYGALKRIHDRGHLICGVFTGAAPNLTTRSLPVLISKKICEIIAVAVFRGDSGSVNITYVDELDYFGFPDEFDVITGGNKEDAINWNPANAGKTVLFSRPYYYFDKYVHKGAEYDGLGKSLSPLTNSNEATDVLSTFVSTLIAGLVYAQREGITRNTSAQMPRIEIYGDDLTFMFDGIIAFAGSYDDVINEALALSDGAVGIGWNWVIPDKVAPSNNAVYHCDFTGNCPRPCMPYVIDGVEFCWSQTGGVSFFDGF